MTGDPVSVADVAEGRDLGLAVLGVAQALAQPAAGVEAAAGRRRAGDGTSPWSTIRFLRTRGSGSGTADSRAIVYGWRGRL
jgi:hypothetical protein